MTEKKTNNAIIVVMLFGVILSLIQFLYNKSIWLDEAMLLLNIINKNYSQLLQPLDNMQVAPIGFLLITKFFSLLLPNSEYGLRLLPLLCFFASMYLFYKIIGLLFKNSKITLLAISLFCLNASLLYYSSEVKQYMVDVFVCLLLYYFFLKEYKNEFNRYLLLALFGAVSIFLSNVSIIILCTIGLTLLIQRIKKRKIKYIALCIPFLSWAVVFAFYYFKFIHNHPNRNGMIAFWGNSFMPLNIFGVEFWDFCFYKTKMIFSSLLSFSVFGLLPFLFFVIGLYKLIKDKSWKALFLLMFPTVLQAALSAFKMYPFDLRLILFQAGFYIIVISIGVIFTTDILISKTQKSWIGLFPFIFPLIICTTLFRNYPAKAEEIKQSIDFISNNIKPNETVYVYYGAKMAYDYYKQSGKVNFKNRSIFGNGFRENNHKYLEEIKQNKQKCWILFSHIYDGENTYITNSLDSVYKKEFVFKTVGSEAYLYDLSKENL